MSVIKTLRPAALLPGMKTAVVKTGSGLRVVNLSRGSGSARTVHPFRICVREEGLFLSGGRVVFNDEVTVARQVETAFPVISGLDALPHGLYRMLMAVSYGRGAIENSLDFYLLPGEKWSNYSPRLPGFACFILGDISIAAGKDGAVVKVEEQKQFDDIFIDNTGSMKPFSAFFEVTRSASGVLLSGGWSEFSAKASIYKGVVGYHAAGDARYYGNDQFEIELSGDAVLTIEVTESLDFNGDTGKISRQLGEVAAGTRELTAAEETAGVYDYMAARNITEDEITVKHVFSIGAFRSVNPAGDPFRYEAVNDGTVSVGGFIPDDWYKKAADESTPAGQTLYLCRVAASGNPAQVETWESLAAMSGGVEPGSGKLYLLGSNFSDPISSGDLLYGHLESGIVNYAEYSGSALVRNWAFTPARPFDIEDSDPSSIFTSGSLYLYKTSGAWHISGNFGAAKVGGDIYPSTPSGYNGARYYSSAGRYLWKYEGAWILSEALGGGMEETDSWWREDTSGTLTPKGTASGSKELSFGFSGLKINSDSPTPPDGSWSAADLGADGLAPGNRTFNAVPEAESVFVADKRSFL